VGTCEPVDLPATWDADGTVVRVERATATVERADGLLRACWGARLLAAVAADPEATPCTGDRVSVRYWPDGRLTVEAVHPRRTLLARGEASRTSRRQLLAANVDVVAVLEGLSPDPDPARVERLLALAWASGAQPVVVLTKADLVADPVEVAADIVAAAVGCRVLSVSAVTGEGVPEVRALLDGGRTAALLGASGVGKSSLVNALAGAEVMRVRALRADGKGRHTTVTRELHRVAGGAVIDGPGLRAVGLGEQAGVDRVFLDVLEHAGACRFADCSHEHEPGCAVLAAVESGELEQRRLDSWRKLRAEGRWQEIRRDARLRAERARVWRARARELRRSGRIRP
jgi:ribosome biogenesis GTPase